MNSQLYERIFPRWRPREGSGPARPVRERGVVALRWMGTAAHVIESDTTRIAIDPFVTRPGLRHVAGAASRAGRARSVRSLRHASGRGRSAATATTTTSSTRRSIAESTGAKLIGSRTTCAFGRAQGIPESQLVGVPAAGAVDDGRPHRPLHPEPARAHLPGPCPVPRRGEPRPTLRCAPPISDGRRVRHL